MDDLKPTNSTPDFGSLTGIMEGFAQIPFEQFQQELHDWFYNSLSEKGIDLQQLQDKGLTLLFHQVFHLSHKYGEYGLMKKNARKYLPTYLKFKTRRLFYEKR